MKISIAHSPDSDDAFMFYGLACGAVPTGDIDVSQVMSDIETLNQAAFSGTYDVSAVSFHAYARLADTYALLPHGASMGDNYGPIVVTRVDGPTSLQGVRVAIPGTLTTAWLALQLYEPGLEYQVMPFDQILEAVRDGQVDAGLLIHEGQLTYADEGLRKLIDLGQWWFQHTDGLPLPLGANVIRRGLGEEMIRRISRLLHQSIAYALDHRMAALAYAKQFGRGLDDEKANRFIDMYVNGLTLDYGTRGRRAVERLFQDAWDKRLIPAPIDLQFAEM